MYIICIRVVCFEILVCQAILNKHTAQFHIWVGSSRDEAAHLNHPDIRQMLYVDVSCKTNPGPGSQAFRFQLLVDLWPVFKERLCSLSLNALREQESRKPLTSTVPYHLSAMMLLLNYGIVWRLRLPSSLNI